MDSDQLIRNIDQIYYQDEDSFNLNHITDHLPDPDSLTTEYLLNYKGHLERLLTVVTQKVSELILSHQPTYINELQRIADLQKSITESISVCSDGRRCLKYIKDGTKIGMTIIGHHIKRESLAKLLESLLVISNLRKSVIETRSLIDNQEDFPRAIQTCKDCRASLDPYSEFRCVNDLHSKLNDTFEMIGEHMDTVLSKMFTSYDPETYLKLNTAYAMMDRGEIAVGQLLMHFNAYHSSSVEELKMFLESELWEMLPVKSDFTLVQLKEFAFLRESVQSDINPRHINRDTRIFADNTSEDLFGDTMMEKSTLSAQQVKQNVSFFDKHDALPIDRISLSSESDLDSELEKDFVDEDKPPPPLASQKKEYVKNQDEAPKIDANHHLSSSGTNISRLTKNSGPVLTNSSLNVLRLAGRYIQMMTVLTPIRYEILMKVYKLLDVYAIFVFRKFSPNNDKQVGEVIASLRESLISSGGIQSTSVNDAGPIFSWPEDQPRKLDQENSVGSQTQVDSKKAIAVESLMFLVNQFWNLQEYLETLITAEQRIQLRELFSQNSRSMVPDFLKARAELGNFDGC